MKRNTMYDLFHPVPDGQEVSYELDPETTGLGITFTDDFPTEVELNSSQLSPNSWYRVDNYNGSGLESIYTNEDGNVQATLNWDMSLPPYICGSKGENRLICKGDWSNRDCYVLLPTENDFPEVGNKLKNDYRYLIDSSSAKRLYVFCKDFANTYFENSYLGTGITLGNYIKVYKMSHLDFEFYAVGEKGSYQDMRWAPTGQMGILFLEDNYAGWGNNGEVDGNGDFQRCTLTPNQLNNLERYQYTQNRPVMPLKVTPINSLVTPATVLYGNSSPYYNAGGSRAYLLDNTQFHVEDIALYKETGEVWASQNIVILDTSNFGKKLNITEWYNFDATYDIISVENFYPQASSDPEDLIQINYAIFGTDGMNGVNGKLNEPGSILVPIGTGEPIFNSPKAVTYLIVYDGLDHYTGGPAFDVSSFKGFLQAGIRIRLTLDLYQMSSYTD